MFSIIGVFLGFIPVIIVISLLSSSSDEPLSQYDIDIVANAEGVRKKQDSDSPVILKLNINGAIGTELLNVNTIRQQLVESREGDLKDNRVKGILLAIDSPGGTVSDADGIYHAIKEYKEKYNVPVYAWVDGMCASGAMYIACAADKIYATDVSIVGSVGVILPTFFNLSQLADKYDIKTITITEGKDKDPLSMFTPWKEGDDKNYRDLTNYYYHSFVNIVSSARPKLTSDKLINEYGARVFEAIKSQEYGYIDEAGHNYSATLKLLLEAVSIKDDKYQVVQFTYSKWLSKILTGQNSLWSGKIVHEIKVPFLLDSKFENKFLYLYQPE